MLTIVDQHTREAMATEVRGPTAQRLGFVDTRGVRSFSQRIEVAISILGTKISPLEVDLIWGQDHCKFLALAK